MGVWVCVATPGQIACEGCVWVCVCVATPGQIACEGCVWVCGFVLRLQDR